MTERHEPVDPRHEEALSAALHAHATGVRPSGDGLVRIRSRVARRRTRMRFLAPAASLATAAAAVTAVVASGIFAHSGNPTSLQAGPASSSTTVAPTTTAPTTAATTPAASAGPSASAAVATAVTPSAPASTPLTTTATPTTAVVATQPSNPNPPVWPFADAAAAVSWQHSLSQKPSEAWHLDSRATATRFVAAVVKGLRLPAQQLTGSAPVVAGDGTAATVDLTRTTSAGTQVAVGTVHLSRWTAGADGPWGVLSVTSPPKSQFPLTIKAPTPGTAVTSPLAVQIAMQGAEDDVYTSAWSAGAVSPAARVQDVVAADKTETLTTGVPTKGSGFVAVVDGSTGNGPFGLSRLAVTPVRFGAGGGTTLAPPVYVAVVGGVPSVFNASDLSLVHHLAVENVTNEVTADGTWAYFASAGTPPSYCVQKIVRARLDGSSAPQVVTAVTAGTLGPVAVGGPGAVVQAWVQAPCGGKLDAATIHWRNTATGASGQIASPSDPPVAETLAVSPDGKQLSAFVRTGNQGNVQTFDLTSATTIDQGSVPGGCAGDGSYECVGATYAPNGDLVVVRGDGQTLTAVRLHAGRTATLFSVKASSQLAHVDVDPTGKQVLVSAVGKTWLWRGAGKPVALPAGVTDASW